MPFRRPPHFGNLLVPHQNITPKRLLIDILIGGGGEDMLGEFYTEILF